MQYMPKNKMEFSQLFDTQLDRWELLQTLSQSVCSITWAFIIVVVAILFLKSLTTHTAPYRITDFIDTSVRRRSTWRCCHTYIQKVSGCKIKQDLIWTMLAINFLCMLELRLSFALHSRRKFKLWDKINMFMCTSHALWADNATCRSYLDIQINNFARRRLHVAL